MRYPRHLKLLDLFGAFAILLCLTFLWIPDSFRPGELGNNLWGNLSTEAVGIWVGVRLIDWIIRENESSSKVRVRTVRNMRFTERKLDEILKYRRRAEVDVLKRELAWFMGLIPNRQKYLDSSERAEVQAFYDAASSLYSKILGQIEMTEQPDAYTFTFPRPEELNSLYWICLQLREAAETNILAETREDDGM